MGLRTGRRVVEANLVFGDDSASSRSRSPPAPPARGGGDDGGGVGNVRGRRRAEMFARRLSPRTGIVPRCLQRHRYGRPRRHDDDDDDDHASTSSGSPPPPRSRSPSPFRGGDEVPAASTSSRVCVRPQLLNFMTLFNFTLIPMLAFIPMFSSS